MRIIKCDVCGEDYNPESQMVEMVIPATWLEDDGEPVHMDVCTWTCLGYVVEAGKRSADQTPDDQDETAEPTKKDQFIAVPRVPTVDSDMDPETLAKYTEQVTGVKRR